MSSKVEVDQIFASDEMCLKRIDPGWQPEELLDQEGVFFLKDISPILGLETGKIKKMAQEERAHGRVPWQSMGASKVWNHWIVRMKVFAPFYRRRLASSIRVVAPKWSGNDLLEQEGIYLLSEVCRIIPFSLNQLRYRAKKVPRSKEVFGVWKDPELGVFVVDMERFAPWIRQLWLKPTTGRKKIAG